MSEERRKPGQGTFRERTDSKGRVRVQTLVYDAEQGKQIAIGTFDSRAKAEAAVWAWHRARLDEGLPTARDPGVLTLRQLGELYMGAIEGAALRAAKGRWPSRVEALAPFIDWPVTQIAQPDVRKWIDKQCRTLIASGRSKGKLPEQSTIQNTLNLLRDCFRWAVLEGRADMNPTDGVTLRGSSLKAPKKKFGRGFDYLREHEAKVIWDARDRLPRDKHVMLMMLMLSGARPIDVWTRRWSDIDWSARSINFVSQKTGQHYIVHMMPKLESVLVEWWLAAGRPDDGYVFPAPDAPNGHHPSGYDAGWADKRERRRSDVEPRVTLGWRTKLGILRPVPLYALRHTCACQLLLGAELFTGGRSWTREEVQSQLGHTSSKTTEHYLVALGLASKKAVEESRAAMRNKRGNGR